MAFGHPQTLVEIWRGKFLTGGHKIFDFIKYPWVTYRCPADHHSVYTVFFTVFHRFFRSINITVPKYRDLNPRIFFDFGQVTPISVALIHLFPGSGVDGDGLYAHIL